MKAYICNSQVWGMCVREIHCIYTMSNMNDAQVSHMREAQVLSCMGDARVSNMNDAQVSHTRDAQVLSCMRDARVTSMRDAKFRI